MGSWWRSDDKEHFADKKWGVGLCVGTVPGGALGHRDTEGPQKQRAPACVGDTARPLARVISKLRLRAGSEPLHTSCLCKAELVVVSVIRKHVLHESQRGTGH